MKISRFTRVNFAHSVIACELVDRYSRQLDGLPIQVADAEFPNSKDALARQRIPCFHPGDLLGETIIHASTFEVRSSPSSGQARLAA